MTEADEFERFCIDHYPKLWKVYEDRLTVRAAEEAAGMYVWLPGDEPRDEELLSSIQPAAIQFVLRRP